jgi:hypothetical protein
VWSRDAVQRWLDIVLPVAEHMLRQQKQEAAPRVSTSVGRVAAIGAVVLASVLFG